MAGCTARMGGAAQSNRLLSWRASSASLRLLDFLLCEGGREGWEERVGWSRDWWLEQGLGIKQGDKAGCKAR